MPSLTKSPVELLAAGVLVLLLAIACVVDVRERRIPNALVAVVLVAGLLLGGLFILAEGRTRADATSRPSTRTRGYA